jgi:hypothetical protein
LEYDFKIKFSSLLLKLPGASRKSDSGAVGKKGKVLLRVCALYYAANLYERF